MLTTNVGYVAKLNRQRAKKGRDRPWKQHGKSENREKPTPAVQLKPGRTIRPPDK